jgi:hypothetical protein
VVLAVTDDGFAGRIAQRLAKPAEVEEH